MQLDRFISRVAPHRTVFGATAVLLPYGPEGSVAWDEFERHLLRTAKSGLCPALNMDTGFGPQLTPAERKSVLAVARRLLPNARMIAGVSAFPPEPDPLSAYRASTRDALNAGAEPIVFQSPWLVAHRGADLARAYLAVTDGAPTAWAFELGAMFAPFGRIYDMDEYARLVDLQRFCGAKHSSLDRRLELARLECKDRARPDWKVLTGNDLAIDMVCYGSDYLLGLSTFDPEAFALRDLWLATGDARCLELSDALQALGAVAFRDPVPAYKDSAATYLVLSGRMKDVTVHPRCAKRPTWEAEILRPLFERVEAAKRT